MRACPKCGAQYANEIQYCSVDGTRLGDTDGVASESMGGEPEPGAVLGSYRLIELVGQGGMSLVYSAEHTRLGRRVAIKFLRREYASNPPAIKRFFQEARSVNQIHHENIVEITDFVEEPGGDNYYVMELLQGETLADAEKRDGPMAPRRAAAIGIQVSRAMEQVHASGIVHRDLKPENVFLIERGGRADFVKLLDFGVAKLVDDRSGKPLHETQAGAIIGTPAYMSMEQAAGREVDQGSDIYSLGIILYELLSGVRPFDAETYGGLVIQHLTVDPPDLGSLEHLQLRLPTDLVELIMACMAKEPEQRPASMAEVAERLEAVLSELGGTDPVLRRLPARRKGRRAWVALAVVALLVAAVVVAISQLPGPVVSNPAVDAGSRVKALPPPDSPPAAPPAPPTVEIALETNPPGARVFKVGSPDSLGTTPMVLPVPKSTDPTGFDFRLANHRTARGRVVPDGDRRVLVVLARVGRTAAPGKPNGAGSGMKKRRKKVIRDDPPVGKDGTLNPFGEDP